MLTCQLGNRGNRCIPSVVSSLAHRMKVEQQTCTIFLLVDVHTILYYVFDDFEASVLNIRRPDSPNLATTFLLLPIVSFVQSFRDGDERVEEVDLETHTYYGMHGTPLSMLFRKLCSCNAETHSSYSKRHKTTFAHFCAVAYRIYFL